MQLLLQWYLFSIFLTVSICSSSYSTLECKHIVKTIGHIYVMSNVKCQMSKLSQIWPQQQHLASWYWESPTRWVFVPTSISDIWSDCGRAKQQYFIGLGTIYWYTSIRTKCINTMKLVALATCNISSFVNIIMSEMLEMMPYLMLFVLNLGTHSLMQNGESGVFGNLH